MALSNNTQITISEEFSTLSTLTTAFVNLALNLLFIPRFGIVAAVVNTVIGYEILALSSLIVV